MPFLSDYAQRKKVAYFLDRIPAGARVLEVGCGSGWVGEYLRSRGSCEYVGLDIVAPADVVGDIRQWRELGLEGGSFDVVIAFEVVEHVDCIEQCCDLLAPGGTMMITTPVPATDPFLRLLERIHLNQRRTSPHQNLVHLSEVQCFQHKQIRVVAGLSQWGLLQKAASASEPVPFAQGAGKGEKAIVVGAGPAGLTAALELLERTGIVPVVIEKSGDIGGISKTVQYRGNRIDIGGHRFFTKSARVLDSWLRMLPMAAGAPGEPGPDPEKEDRVMLQRQRVSRIFFSGQLFDYPITLSGRTIKQLGLFRGMRIFLSYLKSVFLPIEQVENLEQFFINRFGRELYQIFFKSYTEKVWGIPCDRIDAAWGAQRVKGLSIWKAVAHFLEKALRVSRRPGDVETSLIEQFLYPKYGPGQMWEEVAQRIVELGGRVVRGLEVDRVLLRNDRILSVEATDMDTGERHSFAGDYFFSSMPLRELVRSLDGETPAEVVDIAEGLSYRDFITVGLLLERLRVPDGHGDAGGQAPDNWIYLQEPDVQIGRMQIFNNWSPYLLADRDKFWVGLEYFCFDTDDLWLMEDHKLAELAIGELVSIGFIEEGDVLDSTVIRMAKAYPAYTGAFERFDELRAYIDRFSNLYCIGRNGMHRYNNMDHSMLTAMAAVDNIIAGNADKANIWAVNTEQEYHEGD